MRNPSLDVLRGISILTVIVYHSHRFKTPAESPLMKLIFDHGWLSVDLFFVLSGVLITRPLIAEIKNHGRVSPLLFLIRRGFKIYPSFLLLIGFRVLYGFYHGQFDGWALLKELTFLQSYTVGYFTFNWSLSVEEHFYLLVAFFTWRISRGKTSLNAIPKLAAVCMVIGLTGRYLKGLEQGYGSEITGRNSILRMDSVVMGVLVAYLLEVKTSLGERLNRIKPEYLFLTGVMLFLTLLLLLPAQNTQTTQVIGYTLFSLPFATMLYAASRQPQILSRVPVLSGFIAWCGVISYNTYLWHIPILNKFAPLSYLKGWAGVGIFLVCFACCLGAGWLFTRFVERPFLRYRDKRFGPGFGRSPSVPAPGLGFGRPTAANV